MARLSSEERSTAPKDVFPTRKNVLGNHSVKTVMPEGDELESLLALDDVIFSIALLRYSPDLHLQLKDLRQKSGKAGQAAKRVDVSDLLKSLQVDSKSPIVDWKGDRRSEDFRTTSREPAGARLSSVERAVIARDFLPTVPSRVTYHATSSGSESRPLLWSALTIGLIGAVGYWLFW